MSLSYHVAAQSYSSKNPFSLNLHITFPLLFSSVFHSLSVTILLKSAKSILFAIYQFILSPFSHSYLCSLLFSFFLYSLEPFRFPSLSSLFSILCLFTVFCKPFPFATNLNTVLPHYIWVFSTAEINGGETCTIRSYQYTPPPPFRQR